MKDELKKIADDNRALCYGHLYNPGELSHKFKLTLQIADFR